MGTPGASEDGGVAATAPVTASAASDDAAMCGGCVGRFVVRRAIGTGGAGRVVAAYDPVLDREIALKLLRGGGTPASDARLIQEAQAMARLSHPNVVAIHEAGVAAGQVYLVMELVDGGTLRGWLAAPRSWREIRDRFVEAGRGLAAAHAAGLVHRDFKPDNVLIGGDGRARVSDFGLVRAASGDRDDAALAVAGTPRYMAPEQHRGEPADPRADQFAFCVALYEALWRADPFAAPGPEVRRVRVLEGRVAPVPPGAVPARLAAAVLRGLSADPARRHPTMRALLDELERVGSPGRGRRRWLAAALLVAGIVAVLRAARPGSPIAPPGDTFEGAPDPLRFQLGIAVAWPARGDAAELDAVAAAGGTATNLELAWRDIEPAAGARDWSAADRRVTELEQRGLEPFATAGPPPGWLGDHGAACPVVLRRSPSDDPGGRAAFRGFFQALANRYCGRVKYYEFWEPDGCAWGCCGDPAPRQGALYARWLDEWYQAMRDGCSDLVLAVGALDCTAGGDRTARCDGFLDELYQHGAGDSFDAVALHGDAIREVEAALERRGNAGRMLWLDDWSVAAGDPARQADRVRAALRGLRDQPHVFAARYRPASPTPAVWQAFRDVALGPDALWHGPVNPGMEYQGTPPSPQFTAPIPFWAPDGAWALHARFPRSGASVLGRRFGYYSAGGAERVTQVLHDRFVAHRRYCFRSAAQGGLDNRGVVPYQIGYLDPRRGFVVLRTSTVAVDARWRETPGVCHEVDAGPELGRPIAIGFGGVADGGVSDIWFDDLRVTSTPR